MRWAKAHHAAPKSTRRVMRPLLAATIVFLLGHIAARSNSLSEFGSSAAKLFPAGKPLADAAGLGAVYDVIADVFMRPSERRDGKQRDEQSRDRGGKQQFPAWMDHVLPATVSNEVKARLVKEHIVTEQDYDALTREDLIRLGFPLGYVNRRAPAVAKVSSSTEPAQPHSQPQVVVNNNNYVGTNPHEGHHREYHNPTQQPPKQPVYTPNQFLQNQREYNEKMREERQRKDYARFAKDMAKHEMNRKILDAVFPPRRY